MLRSIRGIASHVQVKGNLVHTARLVEVSQEKIAGCSVHTHGAEHNGEVVFVLIMDVFAGLLNETSLPANLCSNLVVWQTGS